MSPNIERTATGVPGFDEVLHGGFPQNNLVVISGDPGAGKTILGLQFIEAGLSKYDENGVFISLGPDSAELLETAKLFGWELGPHVERERLILETVEIYDFDKLQAHVREQVRRVNAKRLVIDPGVIFRLYFDKELDARKKILQMGKALKEFGCTTIITNELNVSKDGGLFGLEEYVADGVVLMYHTRIKDHYVRGIGVLKMRKSKISEKLHPFRIDDNGISVLADQELFEDIHR